MAGSCVLCYITDRSVFAGDERTRRMRLLDKIAEAASSQVDYIQLREKYLPARELESLARDAMRVIRDHSVSMSDSKLATALLINSRTDVALAVSADGVHLRSDDISPKDVRAAWNNSRSRRLRESEPSPEQPVIAVSCHSPEEVAEAAAHGATFAVFAPVFEKKESPDTSAAGLEALRMACSAKIPVLALGGVTLENTASCLRAGAAGIAGIRLFQENDISKVVRALSGCNGE